MLQPNNSNDPKSVENGLHEPANNQQISENPYSTAFEENNQQSTDISHNAPEFSRNFSSGSNKNILLFMGGCFGGYFRFWVLRC